MSNLTLEGMTLASGVAETIVSVAVQGVEGVAQIGNAGTATGFISAIAGTPQTTGIVASVDDEQRLCLDVHVEVKFGYVLPEVAAAVREAAASAVLTQVGAPVGRVDVFIDGLQFN